MPTADLTAEEIERLSLQFAQLQREHDARTEDEARRISRDAIRAWGERVPRSLETRSSAT